jgi:hypothetical protein
MRKARSRGLLPDLLGELAGDVDDNDLLNLGLHCF